DHFPGILFATYSVGGQVSWPAGHFFRQVGDVAPVHRGRASRVPGICAERSWIMGLFSSENLDSFETLFKEQLQDLYDAEQRLVKVLPKMADAAHNNNLRIAFQQHLRETQEHVKRLERVFQLLGCKAESKTCQAMKGLIEEGQEVIDAKGDPA